MRGAAKHVVIGPHTTPFHNLLSARNSYLLGRSLMGVRHHTRGHATTTITHRGGGLCRHTRRVPDGNGNRTETDGDRHTVAMQWSGLHCSKTPQTGPNYIHLSPK